MGKKIDLTGQRFGRLVVVEESKKTNKRKGIFWNCLCDCGIEKVVYGAELRSGDTKSCGCFQRERSKESDNIEMTKISALNSKLSKVNKSGVKGVSWCETKKRWVAQIGFKSEVIYLGRFHNKQDAIQARKEAEEKYFQPILDKYEHELK